MISALSVKRYMGGFTSQEDAARAYDGVAIKHQGKMLTVGLKAKTNYSYTKGQILEILE